MKAVATEDRVLAVVQDQIKQSRIVKASHNLKSDLGRGHIDLLEIVMSLEWEFNIELPDEEAKKCLSVSDLVSIVNKFQ